MTDSEDLARNVAQSVNGMHLRALRSEIDALIKIRVSAAGYLLEEDERELIACLQSLQFLASDVSECRRANARKLRLVK